MILVSGCLAGQNCRYDGGTKTVPEIKDMVERGEAIPVCPEQLGGLTTPRPPAEIRGGDGSSVLSGHAKIINKEGVDVTVNYMRGASDVLVIAKDNNIELAVLKSKSPTCGCNKIYDGTFMGTLRQGDGITTALLKQHGIKVIDENTFIEKGIKEE